MPGLYGEKIKEMFPGYEDVSPKPVSKEGVKENVQGKLDAEEGSEEGEMSQLVKGMSEMRDVIEQAGAEEKMEAIKFLLR